MNNVSFCKAPPALHTQNANLRFVAHAHQPAADAAKSVRPPSRPLAISRIRLEDEKIVC
jgi:hypothetical protein